MQSMIPNGKQTNFKNKFTTFKKPTNNFARKQVIQGLDKSVVKNHHTQSPTDKIMSIELQVQICKKVHEQRLQINLILESHNRNSGHKVTSQTVKLMMTEVTIAECLQRFKNKSKSTSTVRLRYCFRTNLSKCQWLDTL